MKVSNDYKITKSPSKIKDTIKKMVEVSGLNQSIYLEGPSGIGKSELVAQLAKEIGAELIDIRLGHYDSIDLNGIGIPDLENKKAIWTRPEIFPAENCDKKYIIFLDEFNHATEQVFGSAYQFVLERRIGTHILPKNVLIIGAGNSIDDKGISFDMPSPLVNRFLKINVKPNTEDFLEHAFENNIDWTITSFLKSNPDLLHKFDGTSNEDNFPTPRNWFKFDSYKSCFDDEDFVEVVANGLFGLSVMSQFKNHLSLLKKVPQVEDIFAGNGKVHTLTDLNSSYAFYMLVKVYLKNNLDKLDSDNFLNLFKYTNKQPNKEVMQMLNSEVISFVNKNSSNEFKNKFQFVIFNNQDLFKENKSFIESFSTFSKSLKQTT